MADFYVFHLTAGVELQAPVKGRVILVDDIGAADGIDITPMVNGSNQRTMPKRKKAFKCWTDYDAVILRADVDTVVSIFLSSNDVSLGFADGALVNVVGQVTVGNDQGARVPVEIGGSTVNVTADNVGVNNTDANPVPAKINNTDANPIPAKIVNDDNLRLPVQVKNDDAAALPVRPQALKTLGNQAAAVVSMAAPVRVLGDPSTKRAVFRNAHVTALIAIGGAGVTLANAAIVLRPGDVWIEDAAAGADWYAVSDTDNAGLCVMGVKP